MLKDYNLFTGNEQTFEIKKWQLIYFFLISIYFRFIYIYCSH